MGQTLRRPSGGMILPRRIAMTSRIKPVAVQRVTAMIEASTPNFPPVRSSGPLITGVISPGGMSLPDTVPEKMPPWVKFHDM